MKMESRKTRTRNKMVAVCGLICNDCKAFIATQKNDDRLREKVVREWSTDEDPLRLEDVDCDGCIAGKRLHSFCLVCEVRKCGLGRNIENCAYCDEFPCGRLEKLWGNFQTVSGEEARTNLVEMRRLISRQVSSQ
ncbi:MAG: DUF3795 domain-containing protein [Candidatus Bathyarchaeota archaeon]|nr:MAG: DUF3795 domain-containing protein [Candidatus Bathyarchaeota archaeon]